MSPFPRIANRKPKTKRFVCVKCHQVFMNAKYYARHLLGQYYLEKSCPPTLQCLICYKVCNNNVELKVHYKSSKCIKDFLSRPQKDFLRRPQNLHRDDATNILQKTSGCLHGNGSSNNDIQDGIPDQTHGYKEKNPVPPSTNEFCQPSNLMHHSVADEASPKKIFGNEAGKDTSSLDHSREAIILKCSLVESKKNEDFGKPSALACEQNDDDLEDDTPSQKAEKVFEKHYSILSEFLNYDETSTAIDQIRPENDATNASSTQSEEDVLYMDASKIVSNDEDQEDTFINIFSGTPLNGKTGSSISKYNHKRTCDEPSKLTMDNCRYNEAVPKRNLENGMGNDAFHYDRNVKPKILKIPFKNTKRNEVRNWKKMLILQHRRGVDKDSRNLCSEDEIFSSSGGQKEEMNNVNDLDQQISNTIDNPDRNDKYYHRIVPAELQEYFDTEASEPYSTDPTGRCKPNDFPYFNGCHPQSSPGSPEYNFMSNTSLEYPMGETNNFYASAPMEENGLGYSTVRRMREFECLEPVVPKATLGINHPCSHCPADGLDDPITVTHQTPAREESTTFGRGVRRACTPYSHADVGKNGYDLNSTYSTDFVTQSQAGEDHFVPHATGLSNVYDPFDRRGKISYNPNTQTHSRASASKDSSEKEEFGDHYTDLNIANTPYVQTEGNSYVINTKSPFGPQATGWTNSYPPYVPVWVNVNVPISTINSSAFIPQIQSAKYKFNFHEAGLTNAYLPVAQTKIDVIVPNKALSNSSVLQTDATEDQCFHHPPGLADAYIPRIQTGINGCAANLMPVPNAFVSQNPRKMKTYVCHSTSLPNAYAPYNRMERCARVPNRTLHSGPYVSQTSSGGNQFVCRVPGMENILYPDIQNAQRGETNHNLDPFSHPSAYVPTLPEEKEFTRSS